jgi:hypothetical protein
VSTHMSWDIKYLLILILLGVVTIAMVRLFDRL